jgi:hypothetical protein
MKITIIDQTSGSIHELASDRPSTQKPHDLSWFDVESFLKTPEAMSLADESETSLVERIRFPDGREIEVNPETGDLLGV